MPEKSTKILVIGCGGLGCELVKILSQEPSNKLTLVDDDTIDVTNLNRQFLFTKADIGKGKAETVGKKAKRLAGAVEGSFNERINNFKKLDFYREFDIVYNCLDNDEARSFVNQRCHAANVQMVDGGSAGWLGQAFFNGKECFDCLPKRIEKVYPVCTIRQKPKNFEHCLVWAKSIVETENKEALMEEIRCFEEEGNNEIKKKKRKVKSESSDSIIEIEDNDAESNDVVLIKELTDNELIDENKPLNDNLSKEIPVKELADTDIVSGLSNKKQKMGDLMSSFISRLKSDEDSVQLIYEIALLKSNRFNIEPIPFIDAQSFLKNIIPSVCTTNSIIASLMILSAHQKRNFFLFQASSMILNTELSEKKKDCVVCAYPLYHIEYGVKNTVSDFLIYFKAESIVSEIGIFNGDSEELLSKFDGEFVIFLKKGLKNRAYFEIKTELKVIRIR